MVAQSATILRGAQAWLLSFFFIKNADHAQQSCAELYKKWSETTALYKAWLRKAQQSLYKIWSKTFHKLLQLCCNSLWKVSDQILYKAWLRKAQQSCAKRKHACCLFFLILNADHALQKKRSDQFLYKQSKKNLNESCDFKNQRSGEMRRICFD